MSSYWDKSVFCSPLFEPLSIDELLTPASSADESGEAVEFDIADPAWNAEARLEAEAAAQEVAGFLLSLRPRDQEIVHRIFWLGETQASVARSLGVSRMAISKTVKKICKIGRGRLAGLYDCVLLQ
jgi:DNA-directed RNA polymerase specialized sigma subunit